jgi:TIR domain
MSNTESSDALQDTDRVDRVMSDKRVADYISKKSPGERRTLQYRAQEAAKWLVREYPQESDETLMTTLERLLPRLLVEKVDVFFSYKAKDKAIAIQIAERLHRWSDGKLMIRHMADLGVEEVGHNWREKIEKTIPQCDWFLLLLPTPGDERDWVLFEAGYFFRGQGLTGRLVCLHHPDNEVADALGAHQSVPAERDKVQAFLQGLFHKPNWIPGLPPLNSDLTELDAKAREIVDLIKPPTSPSIRFCCGPHMEVAFDDASAVKGWEQLARGRVIDSNEGCRNLFGLQIPGASFGDWIRELPEGEQEGEWIAQLACAVQAVGRGRRVPPIHASFCVASGQRAQPRICAVRRRKSDQRVESVDILFTDAEPLPVATCMKPDLGALSIMLEFAVRLRYQVLGQFAYRKLERQDVLAFQRATTALLQQVMHDRRFLQDPSEIREKTLRLFDGEDKAVVQKMYDRSDQLWRPDAQGEMDRAIANLDAEALTGLVKELLDMNQQFLTVTSKRFAELVAAP